MQYKPIENYHMENVVLGKDFNLGVIGSFFCAFTHQALFSTKTPTIVLQQVNKNTHLELEKKTI